MHSGRFYTVAELANWTLRETLVILCLSTAPTLAWAMFDQTWLAIPWQPVALVGTAVAFVTGFKNNAAYGRLWEARTIWGAIINTSRTWAVQVLDMPTSNPVLKRSLILRHLAWLTALRFQLREPRAWETQRQPENIRYQQHVYEIPEWKSELGTELKAYVGEAEVAAVMAKKNRATHLLAAQSHALQKMSADNELTELRFIELQRAVAALYDCQGRCERIKNFPYPRQFSTLNAYFIWLLLIPLPLALLPELAKFGPHFVWLTIPIGSVVSWIFVMIEKIGTSSENPFEGGPNDVPITAMSRTIEIDLRELLGEAPPPGLQPVHKILM